MDLSVKDLKALNIDVNEDERNSQIELEKEKIFTKIKDSTDDFKTRISLPLLSNDKKFTYVVFQRYNSNKANFLVINTVYKLEKKKKVWRIIDTYETIIQS